MTTSVLLEAAPSAIDQEQVTAWSEAVRVAACRESLSALELRASVRSVARRLNMSAGRAGDLLQIYDAFSRSCVEAIGVLANPTEFPGCSIDQIGHHCLDLLSFRALRRLSRLPSWRERVFGVRRLARGYPPSTHDDTENCGDA